MKSSKESHRVFPRIVGLLLGALLAACAGTDHSGASDAGPSDGGGPPPIVATDYSQACVAASDCALVSEGDVCGCRGCGNTAIAKSDVAKYDSDVQTRLKACPNGAGQVCPAACLYSETTCNAGKCGACHSPGCASPDAGADASSDAARD